MKRKLVVPLATLILTAITAFGQNRPFPQHTVYLSGTIKPNNVTQSAMDSSVESAWNSWKANYLKPAGTGKYYIKYDSTGATVSEAHGYGMLSTVLMAGYDASAKTYFDGLYNYYRAHPSQNNAYLMAWKQDSSFNNIEGADSATDGDMDIAYALLLADKQWGSSGAINYLQAATNCINGIMQSDVNQSLWNLKLGDWAIGTSGNNTRPSDFMIEHMKAYKTATGDARWDNVIATTYGVINTMYANYSPGTGLIPDFVIRSGSTWAPAPANFLEGPHDGEYDYNSCRTPWRFPVDYLFTGTTTALGEMQKMNSWIKGKVSSNPSSILDGYHLNGGTYGTGNNGCFFAPFGVCAMIDSGNQSWLNAVWSKCAATGTESYYDDSVRFLSMVVMSGNYWMPSSGAPAPDFTIAASPSSQTVTAGNGTTYTVTIGAVNGFNSSVSLGISGLPSGASATFNPASVTGSGSSTLTITTTTSVAAGSYSMTVTGTSGTLSHNTVITLVVNTSGQTWTTVNDADPAVSYNTTWSYSANRGLGDYNNDVHYTKTNGNYAQFTFTGTGVQYITETYSDEGNVDVYIDGVLQTTVNCNSATRQVQFVAYQNTGLSSGSHTIKVVKSSGTYMLLDAFAYTAGAPAPDFSISASPSSQTVTAGNGTTYTATVGALNGFSGSVNLSVSGLPGGATGSFNPSSITTSGSSTLSVSTSSSTPAGTYTLTITGTSGSLVHSATVTLVVNAPSGGGALPDGWTDSDIGAVGIAGSAAYTNGVFTIQGSGADIWGTSDQFNYARENATNDFTITARVSTLSGVNAWAKSGVMIRGTASTNSAYVAVYVTKGNGVSMQGRTSNGAGAIDIARQAGLTAPYWVRLVRSGSTFTGYSSADGATWTQVGTTTISMAATVRAGLSVCSHDNTQLNTSTFDNVTVQ
jgi:endo-1,4-beta-D-glucanase Y/regulation of enolase protein 1 (concanavalin A-like superfamily)